MNKQQLASKIWESANKMRSKIEANEYKDYILGFIFYKFLSTKELQTLENMGYPKDKLDIYVMAHNCTDKTAEVSRNLGAIVYEYNNNIKSQHQQPQLR